MNGFRAIMDITGVFGITQATNIHPTLSEVNGDGTINVFDVTKVLQHIVGLIPSFDRCGPQ